LRQFIIPLRYGGRGWAYSSRKMMSRTEVDELTERDALIGRPDEIIRRIKRLQDGGVEYIMVIDLAGSLDHLRIFAREVMPAFS
jgi:hypothetical protein